MNRGAAAFLALLLLATAAFADDYSDGVAAVESKNYQAAIGAFRKAITQAPVETATYLPHYWIGVAKYNLGDLDGALQHWRLSEAQGAIKRTSMYARMQDYVARAQADKQKRAEGEPDAPKKAAEAAMSRALTKQGEAIASRRDRTESYRNGQRKLQDANAEFRKGSYAAAQRLAGEAIDLFSGNVASVPFDDDRPKVVIERPQVESAARAEAAVALQTFRRHILDLPKSIPTRDETREWDRLRRELERASSDGVIQRIAREAGDRDRALAARVEELKKPVLIQTSTTIDVPPLPTPNPSKAPNLEPAWLAYATGDLGASEAQLTKIIAATPVAEAYLLRGCARFTQAVLTREKTDAAAADFREALRRDADLRLDPAAFSPKLVAFFEDLRKTR